MIDSSLDTLKSFAATLANPQRDLHTLGGPVLHYGVFLREIISCKRPAFIQQKDIDTSFQLSTGHAITPWHAAGCMDDRIRTAAFIRGSIQAIENALDHNAHRPLHLIEAGCGPLGTLILPLLAHFGSDQLVISIIDLYQESIECMKLLLEHFGFQSRARQLICGDATTFEFNSNADLILTETMNVTLSHEPQVAITRALMKQHPLAMLIPQSIRVDFVWLNLKSELSHFPPKAGQRQVLGTAFELNRKSALELEEKEGLLPAAKIKITEPAFAGLQPCLTTNIQVFGETQIDDYESQISYPVPMQPTGEASLIPGQTIQFAYRLGKTPGLTWSIVE